MADFTPVIHTYTTPRYLTVNVYLVETEHGVVVIDSATALSTSRQIREIIDQQIKKPLLAVLLTHGHPDHYVGAGEIIRGLNVPIVASQGTVDFAHYQDREKFHNLIERNYGEDAPLGRVFPNQIIANNDRLYLDGVCFRHEEFGPCESGADSIWVVTIDGQDHVFIGDLIYNHTHCYLRDGHLYNWLQGLDRLQGEFDHTALLYPGHGDVCGTEMIYWQRAYLEAFQQTVTTLPGAEDRLDEEQKARLMIRMQSFLPNNQNMNLLKYELDETIALLRAPARRETTTFSFHKDLETQIFKEGILLQQLSRGTHINAVHWNFQDGVALDIHHHHQEQLGYIIKGGFEVTIGNETRTLRSGDAYVVESNIPHRFVAIGETEAIDVFTPVREVGEVR